jgi:hypothetical protein
MLGRVETSQLENRNPEFNVDERPLVCEGCRYCMPSHGLVDGREPRSIAIGPIRPLPSMLAGSGICFATGLVALPWEIPFRLRLELHLACLPQIASGGTSWSPKDVP